MYWRSGEKEIDFVWKRGDEKVVTIEVKATDRWRPEFSKQASSLKELGVTQNAYAVYLGEREFVDMEVEILPVVSFCKKLWEGMILC